jgi:hydroxylamine dehydrogenase
MYKKLLIFAVVILLCQPLLAQEKSSCITCHQKITPGIVSQWEQGNMGKSGMDCSVCHGSGHQKMDDFALANIPTAEICGRCHDEKVKQFKEGKHALAWAAMKAMPMLMHQPTPMRGEGFKGCSGCHKLGEITPEEYKQYRYGAGTCDACHTRHKFSKEEAQNPYACQTCHMGFDHPQWEMWSTSKHGTIWNVEGNTGRAPVCQTCHMKDGNHAVITSWGFLALRLPEADSTWLADRVEILKALGVLDETGQGTERLEIIKAAKVARLTKEEFDLYRNQMIEICSICHSKSFAINQLSAGDQMVRETDRVLAEAIRIVKDLYKQGLLQKPAGWKYAPDLLQFYEAKSSVEQDLYLMFLEYRMRAFQGAFHMNPDYSHWYGWATLKETLERIKETASAMQKANMK